MPGSSESNHEVSHPDNEPETEAQVDVDVNLPPTTTRRSQSPSSCASSVESESLLVAAPPTPPPKISKTELDTSGGSSCSDDASVISSSVGGCGARSVSPPHFNRNRTPDGVLTPPRESIEPESLSETSAGKSTGSLKFYKDGKLCLELSHRDTGTVRCKWAQIRSKTSYPNRIRTLKDAEIPIQTPQPSIFHNPSTPSTGLRNGDGSTSHSMTDDESSLPSSGSPKSRETGWRKQSVPVPHKILQEESPLKEFYMKSAPCIRSLIHMKQIQVIRSSARKRKSFNIRDVQDEVKLGSSQNPNNPSTCACSAEEKSCIKKKLASKARLPLKDIIITLTLTSHAQSLLKKSKSNLSPQQQALTTGTPPLPDPPNPKGSPKKRALRELDHGEMSFRPIKKSPLSSSSRSRSKRSFGRQSQSVPIPASLSPITSNFSNPNSRLSICDPYYGSGGGPPLGLGLMGLPVPLPMLFSSGLDATDGKGHNNNNPDLGGRKGITQDDSFLRRRSHPNSSLAGPNKPNSPVYSSSRGSPKIGETNNLPDQRQRNPSESSDITPEEAQYIQQQTVSKAISYTITSLLGGGGSEGLRSGSGGASGSPQLKYTGDPKSRGRSSSATIVEPPEPSRVNHSSLEPQSSGKDFCPGDQDQNSFLRHLLDTSDPIPDSVSPNGGCGLRKSPIPPPKGVLLDRGHGHGHGISPEVNHGSTPPVVPVKVPRRRHRKSSSSTGQSRSKTSPRSEIQVQDPRSPDFHYSRIFPTQFGPRLNGLPVPVPPPGPSFSEPPISVLGLGCDRALNLSVKGGCWPETFVPSSRGCNGFSGRSPPYPSDDPDVPLNLCVRPGPRRDIP